MNISLKCIDCSLTPNECKYTSWYIPYNSKQGCIHSVDDTLGVQYNHLLLEEIPFLYLHSIEYSFNILNNIEECLINIIQSPFIGKISYNGKITYI